MSLIKVNNLYLSKGKTKLLSDINFELQPGEIMLLTGIPGSGKSLILKILARIIKKYTGEIHFQDDLKKKRAIGYLPSFQYLNSGMNGKDFAIEYLYFNHVKPPKEALVELVKMFTAFDYIDLLRKHLNEMSRFEQKIFFMILLLCTSPQLILIDSLIDDDVQIPIGFLDDYIHYLKVNQVGCIMASQIRHIVPFQYDNLLLVHNGWMVYSARKNQIEKQLEGFIIRLKPPELEQFFRGKSEVDHKIYIKEENAIDIILKKDVKPDKLIQNVMKNEIDFESLMVFKPNIKQFLKYKLEEFNIVE